MNDTSTASWTTLIAAFIRHLLTAAGGALLAAGTITPAQNTELINDGSGIAMIVIGILWSAYQKKQAAKAASTAATVLIAFLLIGSLAACSSSQLAAANNAAPLAVQTAIAADPNAATTIRDACLKTVAVTDTAAKVAPSSSVVQDANKLAHSACDTITAQTQLALNDQKPKQPDGGSIKWLSSLAAAAQIAVTVAPLL
jgi:hypothetical protein